MKPNLSKLIVYGLALFYGWLVVLQLIWRFIRNPSKKFWIRKRRDAPPACLSSPDYGQHSYMQLKDVKLHYVEKGDRTKPLMLMVHGFPEFWYSWRNQITEFSKDYWTVAIDMRGYGDSDKPKGTDPYNIKLLVDDIRQMILALGREKCTLVAHDWGGVIAWHFVLTYQHMIEKYVIMDAPYAPLYAKFMKTNLKQFLSSWYTFFFQLPCLPEFFMKNYDYGGFEVMLREGKPKRDSKVTDEDIEAYKYTFGKPGALTPPLNYYRCNMWNRFGSKSNRPDKDLSEMPRGFLIFGENDRYLHREFVRLSAEAVPRLATYIVPRANHFVQQDDPEAVNRAMRDFLQPSFERHISPDD